MPRHSSAATAAMSTICLGLGLALTSAPAHAEPLTCQGQAVTVAGNVGTAGDDVMVVSTSPTTSSTAGTGNDVICIRVTTGAEPFRFTLDAGPGDDLVVNESTDGNTTVETTLGTGADTYVGNDVRESVVAGAAAWGGSGDASDTEKDVLDTRGGDDYVTSGSVAAGSLNSDVISTGEGRDKVSWAGTLVGAPVDLGTGDNHLALYPGWQAGDLAVDATQAVVTADARPVLRWTGQVTSWTLTVDSLRTRFTGTDLGESLRYAVAGPAVPGTVFLPDPGRRLDADMGGGDDSLTEQDFVGGSLIGGAGEDGLSAGPCLEADVRLGTAFTCLAAYSPRVEYVSTIDAWETANVPGDRVRVLGTPGPDHINVAASYIRVYAGNGDDRLAASGSRTKGTEGWAVVLDGGPGKDLLNGGYNDDKLIGGVGADRLYGGSADDLLLGAGGDDRLWGGKGRDHLRGGAGRDRATGESGHDRCSAEVRRSCERH